MEGGTTRAVRGVRVLRAILVSLCIAVPAVLIGQQPAKVAQWEAPQGWVVESAGRLLDGRVVVWGGGRLTILDRGLRPVGSTEVEGRIVAARGLAGDSVEVLALDPARFLRIDSEARGLSSQPIHGTDGWIIEDAVAFDGDWYLLGSQPGGPRAVVRVSPTAEGGDIKPLVDSLTLPGRMSVVNGQLVVVEVAFPMRVRFMDSEGRTGVTLLPRQSVLDSLTHGSLGVRTADWESGPLLPFVDRGFLQPIPDRTTERTVMMMYDETGRPIGWPLVMGARLEAFDYDPASQQLFGIVWDDGRILVQALRWGG